MPFHATVPVNESAINDAAVKLGASLRAARRSGKLSQERLAAEAGIDLATIRGLERGVGTVRPLTAALGVLGYKFVEQPPNVGMGTWLAQSRKVAGLSQAKLAAMLGITKPTIIQVERGRGNLRSLVAILNCLELSPTFAPARASLLSRARILQGDCLERLAATGYKRLNALHGAQNVYTTDFAQTADEPATAEAARWTGWGTALKPAMEPIILARKPLEGRTVAANVLKWGVGALNIGGCRVGDELRASDSRGLMPEHQAWSGEENSRSGAHGWDGRALGLLV